MGDDRYVDIELGFDRTEAILIAERCRLEGFTVALRLMDDHGNAPANAMVQPHRLSTRAADEAAVRAIASARWSPG